MTHSPDSQPLQINTQDDLSRGRYSNSLLVAHAPGEFVLDWLLNSPNGTHLVSRIIMNPVNVKRTIDALMENLKRYEEHFGPVVLPEASNPNVH